MKSNFNIKYDVFSNIMNWNIENMYYSEGDDIFYAKKSGNNTYAILNDIKVLEARVQK